MYNPKLLLLTGITILVLVSTSPAQDDSAQPDTDALKITTAVEAVARALEYFGAEGLDTNSIKQAENDAKLVEIKEDNTAFFHRIINSRPVWQVSFSNIRLIDPRRADSVDTHLRVFNVLLDSETGSLLKIHSILDGYDTNNSTLPSGEGAEVQFGRVNKEVYLGIPENMPKLSFREALRHVVSSALAAKEIIAVYTMHSVMDREPAAAWAIDLRGISSLMSTHPDGNRYIPEYQRNHFRSVIDAATGARLHAINTPSIGRRPEDRK